MLRDEKAPYSRNFAVVVLVLGICLICLMVFAMSSPRFDDGVPDSWSRSRYREGPAVPDSSKGRGIGDWLRGSI